MRYVSTRGTAPALDFEDVILTGLARDGGLYVPESWPRWDKADFEALRDLSYAEAAVRVMAPFTGECLPEDDFADLIADAYSGFGSDDVAPLVSLAPNQWLLELFHGPTLAFKDLALQVLGRLFDYFLARRGGRLTIVGATSGDTGSAAIEACRGREALQIFMLHPAGRVSDVQRRQMATVADANVHNIAIEGNFDDCQSLVKALFDDDAFRDRYHLGAVNSINWARVMAQVVYYVVAALRVGDPGRAVTFSVPTGNFGDVLAGYVAHRMGLPIERLIVATNRNDILVRFFETGAYRIEEVVPTLSPSMDIQVSSNFERLLFELSGRDGAEVSAQMEALKTGNGFSIAPDRLAAAQAIFVAHRVGEDETLAAIAAEWKENRRLIDPHSAVGIAAGRACHGSSDSPLICLATASAAKFPEAVERATGEHPALPPQLDDLMSRPEHCETLPNDLAAVRAYIAERARA